MLYPEVGGTNPHQKNFLDITGANYPPGSTPPVIGAQQLPDCRDGGTEAVGELPPVPESEGSSLSGDDRPGQLKRSVLGQPG